MYTYILCITVIVITQPYNTTVCEGGTAVFTCVMDIRNFGINTVDIRWWRIRKDLYNYDSLPLLITQNIRRFIVTSVISEYRIKSVLTITDIMLAHIGPYWPGLSDAKELCDMGFLSIVLGSYVHICIIHT